MNIKYLTLKISSMRRKTTQLLLLLIAFALPIAGVAQSTYCMPSYTGAGNPRNPTPGSTTAFYTHILRVSLSNVDRLTPAPANEFVTNIYNDRTRDTIKLTQTAKYPLTIDLGNGANTQTFAVWIDYNQNGIFESTERVANRTDILNVGTHSHTFQITVPKASQLGYTRMRVGTKFGTRTPDPCTNNGTVDWSQHFQDYTVEIVKPNIQLFESVSLSHSTFDEVEQGSSDNEIIRIEVKTNDDGTISPLTADTFYLSLLGSSDPSDIEKASLYYTGKNSQFHTNNLQSSVTKPSIDFKLTSTVSLKPGINYFWLAYDIGNDALLTNRLDARCNGAHIITKRVPDQINPGGSRPVGYCLSKGNRSMFVYVNRLRMNTLNVASFWSNTGYTDFTNFSTNIERGDSVDLSIQVGNSANNSFTRAWIDFNADGDFNDPDEMILFDSITTTGITPTFGPVTVRYKVPNNAKVGPTRMRVTTASKADAFPWKAPPNACDDVVEIGEVEDYTVVISEDGEPVSDFNVSTACLGDSTAFNDMSYTFNTTFYEITSWSWNFGDGNSSTKKSPKHLYQNPGIYKVSLIVNTNKPGTPDTLTKTVVVEKPVVDFSVNTVLSNTQIQFTDQTKGATAVFWDWNFGDPTSTQNVAFVPNPMHVFASAGTYDVRFLVRTLGGCVDSVVKKIKVVDELKPIANFNASTFEPYKTAPITFADLSVNRPNKWTWKVRPASHTFVNGTSASSQNPQITLNNLATYTVTLIAENTAGLDSISRTFVTKDYSRPVADFSANQTQVKAGQIVSFTDLTTNDPTQWEWTFGDGNSSTQSDPLHQYDLTGRYTVSLKATNPAGNSTETKIDYIDVSDEYNMCESDVNSSPLFKGTLFDSGGDNGDYAPNEECSFVIRPDCSGPITITFTEFAMSTDDYVRVFDYDEVNDVKVPFHTGSGFSGSSRPLAMRSTLGAVLVEVQTGPFNEDAGFKLLWSAAPNISPIARIFGDTIAYVNSALFIENKTVIGTNNEYLWDIDNDGIIDDSSDTRVSVLFDERGRDTISLIVRNCKGVDTAYHIVRVDSATSAPKARFEASDTSVFIFDEITLYDLSTQGPNKWKWEVDAPDSRYQYVNGTGDSSRYPEILFLEPGYYGISLVSTNDLGSSKKVVKKRYILVQTRQYMCLFPDNDSSPGGRLTDDGGEDNIYFSRDCDFTLNPCAKEIILDIKDFDYRAGDYLRIYDGEDNTGTPFHTGLGFTASNNPVGSQFTATSGSVYIEHDATGFNNASRGFIIDWSTVPFSQPSIDFEAPDTAYTGGNVAFFYNSTDEKDNPEVSYFWDFTDDGIVDATDENTSHKYFKPGNYKVELRVDACDFKDSIVKRVRVVKPTGKPKARFITSHKRVSTTDVVTFTDASRNGPAVWRWEFSGVDKTTPADYTIIEGRDTVPRLSVMFNKPDTYDVKLYVSNSFGADSLVKTAHIIVFEYCIPTTINAPVGELGISYFELGDIKNASSAGLESYQDFTRVASTNVTRGGTETIRLSRLNTSPNANVKVWIDYNQDGDFDDSDEEVIAITSSDSANFKRSFKVPKSALAGNTRLRVATSLAADANTSCGPNRFGEYEDYRVVVGEDNVKPIITLIGPSIVTVELGDTYVDQGATAKDNVDGNITSKIVVDNKVNTSVEGLYTVTYNVKDSSGNIADEVVRLVDVDGDKTPPVITLEGDNPFLMDVYTSYVDPGATAFDNIDGDVTALIGIEVKVDTFRVGSYKVFYSAYDNAGNLSETVERDVEVLDREAPTITLRGSSTVTLVQNKDTYVEDSADVDDNYYDDVDLIISGSVDVSTVGTYTIFYDATDRSGNTATQVTRTVIVERDISIAEIEGLDELELYPNPTKELLNVSMSVSKSLNGTLRIVDVLGHEMQVQPIRVMDERQFVLDVVSLPAGMYYLEVTSSDRSTTRSFSIVR